MTQFLTAEFVIVVTLFLIGCTIAISLFTENSIVQKITIGVQAFLLIIFVGCVFSIFKSVHSIDYEPSKILASNASLLGQTGDYFGGMLNPILAFASFIALLHTIRVQSTQIKETKEGQELTAFNSTFSIMLDSLRSTPRPDHSRIETMNAFQVSYDGVVTEDRYSDDFYNHLKANCPPAVEFALTFYEFVSFLSEDKATKSIHWSILAASLNPSECYFLAYMSASKLNPMDKKKFKQIANDNRLFRRAAIIMPNQISIGHENSRVDGAWNKLIVKNVGLGMNAFSVQPLDTPPN